MALVNERRSDLGGDDGVDFGLIVRQQRQTLDQMARMRDDMAVLVAITMRLDGTVSGLVQEIRATHSQHGHSPMVTHPTRPMP